MRFSVTHGAVCLGRVRFSEDQVEQLLALFSKEQSWGLFDDVLAARDELARNERRAA